jgi:hypothetical protein
MNTIQSKFFTATRLLAVAMLLALTGCAAVPNRPNVYRPSMYNDGGLYDGYGWNDGYAPYVYGPPFGFGYAWGPEEDGGDDGFIGGGEDNFGDGDGGPGR